ncbi:helix-turn-helix domain-containing protein [Pedobacter sp. KLB.chiD]|uniref:helix-turn-helix domain-containing protein n=1 Tax=Pedobacter sp. KLB.chiD TaxID=3387402 RepID=UPI00399C218D
MEDLLVVRAKDVALNIRKIREYRYYTQEYLAVKLNISQNAYSKIELGYTKLTVERLFEIAVILNVGVAHLLTLNHNDLIRTITDDDN